MTEVRSVATAATSRAPSTSVIWLKKTTHQQPMSSMLQRLLVLLLERGFILPHLTIMS